MRLLVLSHKTAAPDNYYGEPIRRGYLLPLSTGKQEELCSLLLTPCSFHYLSSSVILHIEIQCGNS